MDVDQPPHPAPGSSPTSAPPVQVPVPRPPSPHDVDPSDAPGQPAADSEYIMTDKDREFCLALNKLRRDVTQARFGVAILRNLGPGMIMGNATLERIAERARAHKLRSLDDLYAETQWNKTRELGD